MNIKEKLAVLLRMAADKICPEAKEKHFETEENYKPRKVGLNVVVTKKEIKEARYAEPANRLSLTEAKKQAISRAKALVRQAIYNTIKRERLVNYTITKVGEDISIVGEMFIYVKDDETN